MKSKANKKQGEKIVSKISLKLQKEKIEKRGEQKYEPHDDWTWNDH